MNMKIELNENDGVRQEIFTKYLARTSNVPLPSNFTRIKRFKTRPSWIIIHDTSCLNHTDSVLDVDGAATGMGALKMNDIARNGYRDINFHYILDKLSKDYEVISGRPISEHCEHNDIQSPYVSSIHVLILSDLNIDLPKSRLYQILAYRCLAPLIRMLKMGSDPGSVIRFHDEVMKEKNNIRCPGSFLARELLLAQTRRYM